MTPWIRLTLICGLLLGLFLGLTQAVDWNYQPVVSGSSSDRGTKATSDSPTSSIVGNMAFDLARARPIGSLVLDCGLTARNIAPPGPGEPRATGTDGALASCRPAGNSNQHLEHTFFRKITGSNHQF